MDVNFLNPNLLPWLIPVPPLLAFVLITLVIGRSKLASHLVAIGGVLLSWLMAWGVFFHTVYSTEDFGAAVYGDSINWMDLGVGEAFRMGVLVDPLTAIMLFMVPLAMVMIFVYSVGYMNAYPEDDPHQIRHPRFFAYLSLFAGAMLTLVVADNLLLLFMGWEVMGLCSYLLIGFLFEKKSAYQAAVKAFMTTRVADVLMLVGIGYLYATAGTLNFRELMVEQVAGPEGEMMTRAAALALQDAPLLGLSVASLVGVLLVIGTIGKSAQFPLHVWLPDAMEGPTPVSAMIHAAAMVSAGVYMIIRMYPLLAAGADPHHGHYNTPLILMGLVGSITALGAAVLGVGQDDVKRVLAYSTISQLGFMVAALGIGAVVAAAFHLITHAFFKALLFMSSGAVIHAMEHGEHHAHAHHHGHGHDHDHDHEAAGEHPEALAIHDVHDDHHLEHGELAHQHLLVPGQPYGMMHAFEGEALPEWNTSMVPDGIELDYVAEPNNMRHMGGLLERIPITAMAFLAGGLSLAGFPLLTAGFWSKDEILADALLVGTSDGIYWLHLVVFISLVIAATFTAFYTGRQWLLTFWGKPRSEAAQHATLMAHGANDDYLHHVPPYLRWLEVAQNDKAVAPELQNRSAVGRFFTVYRDSFPMQLPLVILAFFALTAGFVGIHPDFPLFNLFTGETNFFHDYVVSSLAPFHDGAFELPSAPDFSFLPVLFSFAAALGGLGAAYMVYGVKPLEAGEIDPVHNWVGDDVWRALQNRFSIDSAYLRLLYIPFEWFGRKFTYEEVDKNNIDGFLAWWADAATNIGEAAKRFNFVVIDGIGDGIPKALYQFSRWFRAVQTGRVQQYMLYIAAIVLIGLGSLLLVQVL